MYMNLRKMIYWVSQKMFFRATVTICPLFFFNNSLVSVTTVTQPPIILIVNYDTHILQNLCVI